MDHEDRQPIEPGRNVSRMLGNLWASGGLLWAIGAAGVTSLVWAMGTLGSIQSSIHMLEAQKVNAADVRAIIDRESDGGTIKQAIQGINLHNSDIDQRLRKIEIELSRLATLVEERFDREQGALTDPCVEAAVSATIIGP